MFDAELYRSRAEVEEWRKRDPITTFVQRLKAQNLLSDDDIKAIERDVTREIDEAVAFAEAGTWEPVEDLTRFVYSERRAV
jgi:TPP-dependent pyruvate/acetoin dehydrogenase alpha subunit